jgi:hypothetical protein
MPCPKPRGIERETDWIHYYWWVGQEIPLYQERYSRFFPVIFNWTLEDDPISEQAIWELSVP